MTLLKLFTSVMICLFATVSTFGQGKSAFIHGTFTPSDSIFNFEVLVGKKATVEMRDSTLYLKSKARKTAIVASRIPINPNEDYTVAVSVNIEKIGKFGVVCVAVNGLSVSYSTIMTSVTSDHKMFAMKPTSEFLSDEPKTDLTFRFQQQNDVMKLFLNGNPVYETPITQLSKIQESGLSIATSGLAGVEATVMSITLEQGVK